MSAGEEKLAGLVSSQFAELSKSGVKALAARGRADLSKKEQAEERLRKGQELFRSAFDDPGWWWGVCDPQRTSERKFCERILLAHEHLTRIRAGENTDSASAALNMTHEDQELSRTLHFFFPNGFLPVVEGAKEEIERQQAEIAKHEETLREAFKCFQKGLDFDPFNLELINCLVDCYSVGFGVQQDEVMALSLLRRSANLGDDSAKAALESYYSSDGEGGSKEPMVMYRAVAGGQWK